MPDFPFSCIIQSAVGCPGISPLDTTLSGFRYHQALSCHPVKFCSLRLVLSWVYPKQRRYSVTVSSSCWKVTVAEARLLCRCQPSRGGSLRSVWVELTGRCVGRREGMSIKGSIQIGHVLTLQRTGWAPLPPPWSSALSGTAGCRIWADKSLRSTLVFCSVVMMAATLFLYLIFICHHWIWWDCRKEISSLPKIKFVQLFSVLVGLISVGLWCALQTCP